MPCWSTAMTWLSVSAAQRTARRSAWASMRSVAPRYGRDAISDALKAASQGGRGGKIVLVPNGDPPSN